MRNTGSSEAGHIERPSLHSIEPARPSTAISAVNARNASDRRGAWLGLVAGSVLLLALTVPWGNLQDHSHWHRVRWLPFISRRESILDIADNVLLAMPIGAVAARVFRRPVLGAAILTLTLSVAGEWTQVYSHHRIPSVTDVAFNVAGAMSAAALMRKFMLRT